MPLPILFTLALPALELAMGKLGNEAIWRFVNMGIDIVAAGFEMRERLAALNATIQKFVDENRDPTKEEWLAMFAENDAAREIIRNS